MSPILIEKGTFIGCRMPDKSLLTANLVIKKMKKMRFKIWLYNLLPWHKEKIKIPNFINIKEIHNDN